MPADRDPSPADWRAALRADLAVYGGRAVPALRRHPGFRWAVLFRLNVESRRRSGPGWLAVRTLTRAGLAVLRRRYDVPPMVPVGPGLFLSPHPGAIVVNGNATLGAGCHLNHGVTIGETPRGKRRGSPVLEDGVYLGAGATVLGRVVVGAGAVIGAGCVVSTDVPAGAVLAAPRPVVLPGSPGGGYASEPVTGQELS